jgi:hypothetical protein
MDSIQNSFNLASDLDKQINICRRASSLLASLLLRMSLKAPKFGIQILLYCAWVCFLFAICAGLITMGKLTSASLMLNQSIGGATQNLNSVIPFALLEEGIFLLGVFFTLGYGIGAGLDAAKQSRINSGQSTKVVAGDKHG